MTATRFVLLAQRSARQEPESRLEYRIWPRRWHPAVSVLQSAWLLVGAERRADIYLVTALSDRVLVKLRGGSRLEIKRRREGVDALQRWRMELSTGFPLSAPEGEMLGDALGLAADLSPEAGLSAAHLMAELDSRSGHVLPRTVGKSRLLFEAGGVVRTGGCRAEICRVSLGRRTALTVALEGTEPGSMTAATRGLSLDSLPNRSYGEALLCLVDPEPQRRSLPALPDVNERRTQ